MHARKWMIAGAFAVFCVNALADTVVDGKKVTGLKRDKVPLYSQSVNGTVVREVSRDEFKQTGAWRIVAVADNKMLQVEVDGKRLWVRPYAVDTDLVLEVPKECGVKLTTKTEKLGATRGLGEECKP